VAVGFGVKVGITSGVREGVATRADSEQAFKPNDRRKTKENRRRDFITVAFRVNSKAWSLFVYL
jgi:hypothetical protein